MSLSPLLAACGAALTLAACGGGNHFSEPVTLGGRVVQPATLNRGRDVFNRFCATCHGHDGKAQTAQARQLDPAPRDFTLGEFKRASPGQLPTDAELSAVIVHGVPGTGMPPWPQLQGDDLDAVVQYLKTFSPRWRSEAPSTPKKSDTGAMNVLPAGNDAASFRAARRATSVEGSGVPERARALGSPVSTDDLERRTVRLAASSNRVSR